VHQRSIQVEEKDAQRAYLRGFSTSTQAERWTPARPIGQKCSAEPQRRLENQLVMSKSMPLKVLALWVGWIDQLSKKPRT
jgi:hypothetical protein